MRLMTKHFLLTFVHVFVALCTYNADVGCGCNVDDGQDDGNMVQMMIMLKMMKINSS